MIDQKEQHKFLVVSKHTMENYDKWDECEHEKYGLGMCKYCRKQITNPKED